MSLRWFLISFATLFVIGNPVHAGIMDNIRDGMKFISDSIVYTTEDVYGSLGFLLRLLKLYIDEQRDHTPSNNKEYDFIVVGAGSAGAAVSARLSEMKNAKVLLIEGGSHENLFYDIPLAAIFLWADPFIDWGYKSEPSNEFCLAFKNNQCKFRQGKGMGGSSMINFMIACRGTKNDYDKWAEVTGDQGWSYEGMLKYFKKLEKSKLTVVNADPEQRGTDGPVDIINPPYRSPLAHAFVKAGEELGFSSRDYNTGKITGFNYMQTNQRHGERLSSNRAYLYPAKSRKNLVVSMNSHVNKVIIDPMTKTATGVEFTKHGRKINVFAKREVILSAGALNTPKILMLSGVGPAKHLQSLGIDVIADLPVGESLVDHTGYGGLIFLVNETVGTDVPDLLNPANPTISAWVTKRDGLVTTAGGTEGVAYMNADNLDPEDENPNIELMFASLSYLSAWVAHGIFGQPDDKFIQMWGDKLYHHAWLIWPLIMKPKSRGRLLLRSTNPNDKPKIYPHHFEDPEDIRIGIKAIRMAIKVSKTQAMQKFGTQLLDRPFWGCEGHEPDSDAYWTCAMRSWTLSLWHYCGTTKMGKEDDPSTVVNSKLQVKGIKNLRVIDGGIMPEVPVAHTNIPCMAIGEKGADLVKADHQDLLESSNHTVGV